MPDLPLEQMRKDAQRVLDWYKRGVLGNGLYATQSADCACHTLALLE